MLEFVVTLADARERCRWLFAQSNVSNTVEKAQLLMATRFGLGAALTVLAVTVSLSRAAIGVLAPAAIVGLLFFLLGWRRAGRALRRLHDSAVTREAQRITEAAAGVQQVWLDERGISVRDGDSYLHLDWAALSRVVDTPEYAIVECRADYRIFLPRAAGPGQVAHIAAEIRRRLRLSTEPGAP